MLTVTHESNEWVAVQRDLGEVEHLRWMGFCTEYDVIDGEPCYILCNGWRMSYMDNWNYLNKEEFAAGVVTRDGVYCIRGERKPITCEL